MSPKKTLYLNNIAVGEVEVTGDTEKDTAAAVALLKQKGLYREIPQAEQMFRGAWAFASVASDIFEKHYRETPPLGFKAIPFVVNAAFSIELYLKTLQEIDGRAKRVHSLLDLYDSLSGARRAEIASAAQTHAPRFAIAVRDEQQFRANMRALNSAFVEWRYLHEKKYLGDVQIEPTVVAIIALESVCRAAGASGPNEEHIHLA